MLSRGARWLVVFAVWAAIGSLLTLELYLSLKMTEGSVSVASVAFGQFMRVFLWALLTPVVIWCQRNIPINRRTWYWTVPLHLALSAGAMALIYLVRLLIAFLYYGEDMAYFWDRAFTAFYGRNLLDIPLYWAVYGAGFTLTLFKRFQESEVRSAQLENDLAQAEMKALKAQLHPHFLFNTLNTISVLIRDGQNKEAVSLIAKLSALLRFALETTGQQEITLGQELDFLRRYLDIQRARFSDRLEVHFDIEPAVLDAYVPNLLLQPLVENAVLHGFANKTSSGRIEIRGELRGARLRLVVRDDGPGFAATENSNSGRGGGIGLANTRDRLKRMYGDAARLTHRDLKEGGAEVEISIPYRRRGSAGIPVVAESSSSDPSSP